MQPERGIAFPGQTSMPPSLHSTSVPSEIRGRVLPSRSRQRPSLGRRLLPLRRGHGFRNLATEPERFGEHRASFGISRCRQRMIAPQRPPLAVFISAQTVLCIVRIRFPPPERVWISWDFAFPRQKGGFSRRCAGQTGRSTMPLVCSRKGCVRRWVMARCAQARSKGCAPERLSWEG